MKRFALGLLLAAAALPQTPELQRTVDAAKRRFYEAQAQEAQVTTLYQQSVDELGQLHNMRGMLFDLQFKKADALREYGYACAYDHQPACWEFHRKLMPARQSSVCAPGPGYRKVYKQSMNGDKRLMDTQHSCAYSDGRVVWE